MTNRQLEMLVNDLQHRIEYLEEKEMTNRQLEMLVNDLQHRIEYLEETTLRKLLTKRFQAIDEVNGVIQSGLSAWLPCSRLDKAMEKLISYLVKDIK